MAAKVTGALDVRMHPKADAATAFVADRSGFFPSGAHEAALSAVLAGIEAGEGFLALLGEAGAGKTAVLEAVLARQPGAGTRVVRVDAARDLALGDLAPGGGKLGVPQFLEQVIGRARGGFTPDDVERGHALLTTPQTGEARIVLVIDHAEHLRAGVFAYLGLLSTMSAEGALVPQVVFLAAPEFAALLQQPELRTIAGRIKIQVLPQLSDREAREYIAHLLRRDAGSPVRTLGAEALQAVLREGNGNMARLGRALETAREMARETGGGASAATGQDHEQLPEAPASDAPASPLPVVEVPAVEVPAAAVVEEQRMVEATAPVTAPAAMAAVPEPLARVAPIGAAVPAPDPPPVRPVAALKLPLPPPSAAAGWFAMAAAAILIAAVAAARFWPGHLTPLLAVLAGK